MLWISSDWDQHYSISQKTFKSKEQYLSEKATAEQFDSFSHSDYELLKKSDVFDSNVDVFDVENVKLSDSNCESMKSNFISQKSLQFSKLVKLKTVFMRMLFKSIYLLKKDLKKVCLSRKFDLCDMFSKSKEKNSVVHINTAYKWKTDKIKSVDSDQLMSEASDELANWWEVLWAQWMKHSELIKSDSFHWYDAYITSRFSRLSWEFWLTSECIEQLKINPDLSMNEWDFLLKILMRCEECLM